MESLRHPHRSRLVAPLLGLAALVLAGCATTDPYDSDPYATYPGTQPVYPNGQPAYPAGQPVYSNGQPVYPNGQPVYSQGQTVYTPSPYGQPAYSTTPPVYGQPGYVYVDPTGYSPDDYIYYPSTEVYYSPFRRQFIYRDGRRWYAGNEAPRYFNRGGPSVRVRFQDGPEHHHDEMRRRYPGSWRDYDHDRYGR